jgi:nitric oxide reductase subunit B
MAIDRRRNLIVSGGWIQAAILVILVGFTILLYLAYRVGVDAPPIPARITDPNGRLLFTGPDILAGQQVFLSNGLMEYGSIFGHGAYLGPDFTADYLRKAATRVRDQYGGVRSDQA